MTESEVRAALLAECGPDPQRQLDRLILAYIEAMTDASAGYQRRAWIAKTGERLPREGATERKVLMGEAL